jgi:hypothetical protein
MAFVRRRPAVGLLAARIAVIDEHGEATGEVRGHDADEAAIAPTMLFWNCLATSTIVVDRALVAGERFDPALTIGSDYDMWLRLISRTNVACLPDVLVKYREHASNITTTQCASADACVERIFQKHLSRLGLNPSPADLALHRRLGSGRLEGTDRFLCAAATWLETLRDANDAVQMYAAEPLRRVLTLHWLAICEAAARERGWQAWPQMARLPFAGRLVRDTAAWPRLARLPWRSTKTSLKRALAS